MKYYLRVYDNYHHADESEAYNHGQFETYAEAVNAAKAIVDEFFETNWRPGIKADELLGQYGMYGEDPMILPVEDVDQERFSARSYAETSVVEICQRFEKK